MAKATSLALFCAFLALQACFFVYQGSHLYFSSIAQYLKKWLQETAANKAAGEGKTTKLNWSSRDIPSESTAGDSNTVVVQLTEDYYNYKYAYYYEAIFHSTSGHENGTSLNASLTSATGNHRSGAKRRWYRSKKPNVKGGHRSNWDRKQSSATQAPVSVRAKKWVRTHDQEAKTTSSDGIKTMYFTSGKSSFPQQLHFGRCALIGSSASMQGKMLGPEIDNHDVVIRVNKLPATERYFTDWGRRTDIYFTNPFYLNKKCDSYPVQLMGGNAHKCNFASKDCGFQALVFKGADLPFRSHTKSKGKDWKAIFTPDCTLKCPQFPCAIQNDLANSAAYFLLAIENKAAEVTTGFHAFITFAPICTSLHLYGFGGGRKTADGHKMLSTHSYEEEWKFWDLIRKGVLRLRNYNGKSDALRELRERIVALVQRGGLIIHKPSRKDHRRRYKASNRSEPH